MSKWILFCGFFLLLGFALAQTLPIHKLWVNKEYDKDADRIYFIQDLETGARCYAIAGGIGSGRSAGYAISCVR